MGQLCSTVGVAHPRRLRVYPALGTSFSPSPPPFTLSPSSTSRSSSPPAPHFLSSSFRPPHPSSCPPPPPTGCAPHPPPPPRVCPASPPLTCTRRSPPPPLPPPTPTAPLGRRRADPGRDSAVLGLALPEPLPRWPSLRSWVTAGGGLPRPKTAAEAEVGRCPAVVGRCPDVVGCCPAAAGRLPPPPDVSWTGGYAGGPVAGGPLRRQAGCYQAGPACMTHTVPPLPERIPRVVHSFSDPRCRTHADPSTSPPSI